MKMIKFVPVLVGSVLLAACAQDPVKVIEQANEVGVSKVTAYQCGNDSLVATYSFVDNNAQTAKVLVNNQVVPDIFVRNPKNQDVAEFLTVAGDYNFKVDKQLNAVTYNSVNVVELVNTANKTAVAQSCVVNVGLTELLNK